MYLRSLIPQDTIPQKFFDEIEKLREKHEQVHVHIAQGEDFYPLHHEGEYGRTNCWIEISTDPLPLEAKPVWRPLGNG